MGRIADALRRRRTEAVPSIEQLEAIDPGQSLIGAALSGLGNAGLTAIQALGVPGNLTRQAIGAATGIEGEDGAAPTGEQLLSGLVGSDLSGTTTGAVGGFATEVLADPLNLISFGTLTTGGKLAQRASRLATKTRAAAAAGRTDEALDAARALRGLQTSRRLAPTIRQQALEGDRALVNLDVPFGPKVPLVPRGLSANVLGPIAQGASAAGRVSGLSKLFRSEGKIGDEAFDSVVDEGTAERRTAARDARIAVGSINRALGKMNVQPSDVQGLQGRMAPLIQDELTNFQTQFGIAPSERIVRQLNVLTGVGRKGADLASQATILGTEAADLGAKAAVGVQAINDDLARSVARINATRITFPASEVTTIAQRIYSGSDPDKIDAAYQAATRVNPLARRIVREANKLYRGPDQNARAAAIQQAIQTLNLRVDARISRATQAAAMRAFPILAKERIAGELLAAMPTDVAAEARRIAAVNGTLLTAEQQVGSRVASLTDPMLGYLRHAITPEGQRLAEQFAARGVNNPIVKIMRWFSPAQGFTKQRVREFEGLGVMQANDFVRDIAQRAGIKFEGNFFSEDLADIMLRRITESGRSRGDARVMRGVARMFAVPASTIDKSVGSVPIEEFLARSNLGSLPGIVADLPKTASGIRAALAGTSLDGLHLPANIANAALFTENVFRNPESLRPFLSFMHQANSAARLGVTLPFPGYFLRNFSGNLWNMWLAGFRSPFLLSDAGATLLREARGQMTLAERAEMRRLVADGVIDTGQATETLGLVRESGLGSRSRRGVRTAIESAQGLNRALENTAKLALYRDGMRRGLSHVEAADRVRKYLFDYSDLSSFEKKWLRPWVFFYTFMRKNMPLQFEALLTNPGKMKAYGLLTGRIGESIQREELPRWMENRGLIPVTTEDEDGNRVYVELGLPAEDLFRFADEGRGSGRVVSKLLAQLPPIQRAPIEFATNRNLSTGLPTNRLRRGDEGLLQSLPEGVAREISPLLLAERFAPTSRLTGTIRRSLEAAGSGQNPLTPISTALTGVGVAAIDPAVTRGQRLRETGTIVDRNLEALGVPRSDPRRKAARRAAASFD